LLEASLVGVPANADALAKGPDLRPADELIRFVLREWALSPDGRQICRAEFDRCDEVGKRIKNGQFVVNRDRVEALERAAKAKRLADQRAREIAIRRARSET